MYTLEIPINKFSKLFATLTVSFDRLPMNEVLITGVTMRHKDFPQHEIDVYPILSNLDKYYAADILRVLNEACYRSMTDPETIDADYTLVNQ